jgi:hypothetical protein
MFGKKCSGKIDQIGNDPIIGIRPEGSKLKAVTGLAFLMFAGTRILDGIVSGRVGIILGIGAIGDYKDLHILKQTTTSPE